MTAKKFFDDFEEIVGAGLFVIIFAVLVAQIVSRQVFDNPLVWSEELALVLFTYVGILGVCIGIKNEQHVMIDFLYNKLSPRWTKIVFTLIQVIIFVSIVTITFLGYKLFQRKLRFELIALKISSGWVYASLPAIGCLMIVRFFQVIKKHYATGKLLFSPKVLIENYNYPDKEEGEK